MSTPTTFRLFKVDDKRRRHHGKGTVIRTPGGTWIQKPKRDLPTKTDRLNEGVRVEPESKDDQGRDTSRPPSGNERQYLVWRDVVIPALLKPYAHLFTSSEGLAKLREMKGGRLRCEGCPGGYSLKVICLYFDRGLRKSRCCSWGIT